MTSFRYGVRGPRGEKDKWRLLDRKPRRPKTVAHFYGPDAEDLVRFCKEALNARELGGEGASCGPGGPGGGPGQK